MSIPAAEMGALDSHSSLLLAPKFPGSDPKLSKLQMMTGFWTRFPKGTQGAEDPTTQSIWQVRSSLKLINWHPFIN